jgi:hypothetical protein
VSEKSPFDEAHRGRELLYATTARSCLMPGSDIGAMSRRKRRPLLACQWYIPWEVAQLGVSEQTLFIWKTR